VLSSRRPGKGRRREIIAETKSAIVFLIKFQMTSRSQVFPNSIQG